MATSLHRVLEFLTSAQPRRLRPALRDVVFVYTDAFQEGADNLDMGLGAVVQDQEGTTLGWFGLMLPRDVAEDILRDGSKCINELESLTVALCVRLCATVLLQRHVVFYLDNDTASDAERECYARCRGQDFGCPCGRVILHPMVRACTFTQQHS